MAEQHHSATTTTMQAEVVDDAISESANDSRLLVPRTRTGDVISPHRAVLTLAKSMFNAGCFSLPYAWKLGGLWSSFVLTFVIAGLNWYGNHILVRSSQHLASVFVSISYYNLCQFCSHEKSSLDYGHFTKKVCDNCDIPYLRRNSKSLMYIVNVTILFYQLGMCSVSVLFISDNLINVIGIWTECRYVPEMIVCATIAIVFILATNMFTEIRVISLFAMISTVFFMLGAVVIMQNAIQQPTQIAVLPAYTDFKSTMMFFGISMYAFEGQTMILPIENKLRTPDDFLGNCGVLPTTMMLCSLFMCALGFYGYTAFGDGILQTITLNMPHQSFYAIVNVFLMIQSMLGHSIAMYVVFDMFFNGFRRKFYIRYPNSSKFLVDKGFRTFWVLITYLMAIAIPHLDIMIPLVGVTSGTLCALVYPPILEMLTFWRDWRNSWSMRQRVTKIVINIGLIVIGICAIIAGLYANIDAMVKVFSGTGRPTTGAYC